MEAIGKRIAGAGGPLTRALGTRGGTLALAAGAAVLAAIILIAFLGQYKDNVKGGAAPTSALVAGALIPKGTAGDVVIGEQLFKPTTVPTDDLREGALVDASAIAGKVAVRDIYPGQQITAADFDAVGDPIRGKLTGDQRAVSVPVSTSGGLIGHVKRGDRVDVMASFTNTSPGSGAARPSVRTLMQNVLVLAVPKNADNIKSGRSGDVTLRVSDNDAAKIAFAAENGKIWLALRPPAGASEDRPATADFDSLSSAGSSR
jgi:pilus assembly protein CpaB